MCRIKNLSAGAIALLLLACFPSDAQEPKKQAAGKGTPMKLVTEKVIVFKDGYALVLKKGVATTDERGEIHTDQVPDAAVLGSFWAVPKKGRLVSMTAGWRDDEQEVKRDLPCTETLEILLANKGKSASVVLNDKTALTGVIREVLVQEHRIGLPVTLRKRFGFDDVDVQPGGVATETLSAVNGSRFVLGTAAGDVLVSANEVRTLTVKDMKTTLERTARSSERTKQLTFRFAEKNTEKELTIMYFRPGLRWIPSYRVQLGDREGREGTARVSLQAELVNGAEDLTDVPVDIVVGVPNFRFKDSVSPLVLESTLRRTMHQAEPQLFNQALNSMSNAVYASQVHSPRRQAPGSETRPVQLPGELTAAGAQDLFVYSLPKLDLAKGERAALSITSTEAPYKHIYTWDMRVRRHDNETAPGGSGIASPLDVQHNQVWHQIDITNTSDIPWTTGAALIMQGDQPVAQELLTYTSPGCSTRVPMTISVDTRGTASEKETAREMKSLKWDGYTYAKISKQASLVLRNNKQRTVEVEIRFHAGGKADATSHQGQVTVKPFDASDWHNYRGSPVVNNSSVVSWTVELKYGEEFKPTVDYHYFARH